MIKKSILKILLTVIFPLMLIVSIGSGFGYWVYGANIQSDTTNLAIHKPSETHTDYVKLSTLSNLNILQSITLQRNSSTMSETPVLNKFSSGVLQTENRIHKGDYGGWFIMDKIYYKKGQGFYHNFNASGGSEVDNPVITSIVFKAHDKSTVLTFTDMNSTLTFVSGGITYLYTVTLSYTNNNNISEVLITEYTITYN